MLELIGDMPRMTRDRVQDMALENARHNQPYIARGESLRALRGAKFGEDDSAVIIAGGPSIKRENPIAKLKAAQYRGAIIATESAISYCFSHDVVPSLIVSTDPHPKRISRWLGDRSLSQANLGTDDYFRRQDLDASFANELANNSRVLDLVDRYGKGVPVALASTAAEDLVSRIHEIGMKVYWWNPMLDDPDELDGVTRVLCKENGLPAMNAGGNVGTASWMLAHAVLGKRRIALTGMDFGYYADTPYDKTQYYHEALALVGPDKLDDIFIKIFNPHTQSWFYTDPAYYWYRQAFLELSQDADCVTTNCTGGGTLFGESVAFAPLDAFLSGTTGS